VKVEQEIREIQAEGILSEANFGISSKQEDQVFLVRLLRDKMYSNKVLAVVREYTTNAVDANIEAGNDDIPIQVKLPTRLDPVFKVRDHGLGLSEKEVYEVYIQYGRSTKRQTNDAIGQLGIGCKAAFAYTDSYTITSWHEGQKTTYHAFIDESDMGKVVKMGEEASNEPNGIEIAVAVKQYDISDFEREAINLFKYFRVTPEVNTEVPVIEKSLEGDWWYVPVTTKDYYGRINRDQAKAVMGGIPYPINGNQLGLDDIKGTPEYNLAQGALQSNAVIWFDIGELQMSANRESLEYKEGTIKNIRNRLIQVGRAIGDELNKKPKMYTSLWEARKGYWEQRNSLPAAFRDLLKKDWNGHNLTAEIKINRPNGHNDDLRYMSQYSGRRSVKWDLKWDSIEASQISNSALVINDTKQAWVTRARELMSEKDIYTIIILMKQDCTRAVAEASAKNFIKEQNLDGIDVYYLSDRPTPVSGKISSGCGWSRWAVDETKAKSKVFEYDGSKHTQSYNSDYWDTAEVDLKNDSGVYVPLYRYIPKDPIYDSNVGIYNAYNALKRLDPNFKLYGIKRAQIEKLGKGWTPLHEFVNDIPEKYYKKFKSRIDYARIITKVGNQLGWLDYWSSSRKMLSLLVSDNRVNGFLGKLAKSVDMIKSDKVKNYADKLRNLESSLSHNATKTDIEPHVQTLVNKVENKYPLLGHITNVPDNKIIGYIQLIDQIEAQNAATPSS
jgi:hypothetical protein